MAAHGVLPQLIIILGDSPWEPAWMALCVHDKRTFPAYEHLAVREYETAPDGSPIYTHANRIKVHAGGVDGDLLLVRLHHPSAHAPVRKNAAWLFGQPDFKKLAQIS